MLRRYEYIPIVLLLGLTVVLTIKPEPVLNYAHAAAESLNNPEHYVMSVIGTRPIPSPESKAAMLEVQP